MAASQQVDFYSSARRHHADAELLEAYGRLPNAGHLYGFVAECGLKALLMWHGCQSDIHGSPANETGFRKHIDRLVLPKTLSDVKLFLHGRSGANFLAMIPLIDGFLDWSVDHRYYAETALPASLPKWRAAARQVGRMLDYAKTCGLVQ
jgi:hypothetical protein